MLSTSGLNFWRPNTNVLSNALLSFSRHTTISHINFLRVEPVTLHTMHVWVLQNHFLWKSFSSWNACHGFPSLKKSGSHDTIVHNIGYTDHTHCWGQSCHVELIHVNMTQQLVLFPETLRVLPRRATYVIKTSVANCRL